MPSYVSHDREPSVRNLPLGESNPLFVHRASHSELYSQQFNFRTVHVMLWGKKIAEKKEKIAMLSIVLLPEEIQS